MYVSGVRVVCVGHPQRGLRDDLLRGGERHLLASVRLRDEVRGSFPTDGPGCAGACVPRGSSSHLEAKPQLSSRLLRHLRAVGRGRRGVADTSQR